MDKRYFCSAFLIMSNRFFMWSFVRSILQTLGLKGEIEDVYPVDEERQQIGTDGKIDVDVAVVVKGEKLVMAIDCDLGDVPSWVEWDLSVDQFSIAQNSGSVVHISSKIAHERVEALKKIGKLMLVTSVGSEKVAHHIPFVVRDKAA